MKIRPLSLLFGSEVLDVDLTRDLDDATLRAGGRLTRELRIRGVEGVLHVRAAFRGGRVFHEGAQRFCIRAVHTVEEQARVAGEGDDGDLVAGDAVDEDQWKRRNASVPLVPPKPNELESATSIFISRAVPGT